MKQKNLLGLLFIALVIISASCKKSGANSASDSYLKIKMNGTWITYKNALGELGPDLGNASKTDLGLTATSDDSKNVFDFTVQINGSNFTTGVYDSDNPAYLTDVSILTGAGTAGMANFMIDDAPGRTPSKYLITISSITSTQIKGTFTGNYLYNSSGSGTSADILDITEGEFSVKRIR